MTERYWAVAQTVSKMEHIARREIEKTNHGTFLPTYARSRKVDGHEYRKEIPLFTGYVFFMTEGDDWAGIPDIHGVYRVPTEPDGRPQRIKDDEFIRMFFGHVRGQHNERATPRYTRYYNPDRAPRQQNKRRRSRPRRSKMLRSEASM